MIVVMVAYPGHIMQVQLLGSDRAEDDKEAAVRPPL